MAQEQLKSAELQSKVQEAVKSIDKPAEVLDNSIKALEKFGGFDLLETGIDAVQNINPERKARKKIFLEESSKKAERDALKKSLQWWSEILNSSDDISAMIETCQQKSDQADQVLKKNLKAAVESTQQLERSYRSVALFFKNTESTKVKNVSLINAEPDQLKDLDNTRFIDAIQTELVDNYDRLDLRNNYSLLILPGYLGSNKVVEKWAKVAYENKVMLVTDFEDLEAPDDVMELFEAANLTGGDSYRSNVIMSCNWLVGRGKFSEVGEEEDLFVPPAGALGGKIYNTLMSQVTAGKKHGGMNEVDGVRFDLKKSEIASLEKLGLVPMVKEYGKVMAFSAKTLFNGDNLGLQTYSVVRVFDYVAKVMMDFLNRRAFENFTANTRKELNGQIVKFLDSITGPNKLIENFEIRKFEQDPVQKDKIYLDIHMKPYFPAKTFLIKLEGQKGDDGNEWSSEYAQDK
jgi:Type VI secretion system, TssC, VipB